MVRARAQTAEPQSDGGTGREHGVLEREELPLKLALLPHRSRLVPHERAQPWQGARVI